MSGERAGRLVVVMGVCGSGKTTVGCAVAARVGGVALDADAFHDAAAVGRMARGEALTDEDRWPWLDRVGGGVRGAWAGGGGVVVLACSALRRSYREALFAGAGAGSALVYLRVDEETARARVSGRGAGEAGSFMPAGLVGSQFAALEEPTADECGGLGSGMGVGLVVVDGGAPVGVVVDSVVSGLGM